MTRKQMWAEYKDICRIAHKILAKLDRAGKQRRERLIDKLNDIYVQMSWYNGQGIC